MTTHPSSNPANPEREERDPEARHAPVMVSRPLIYTKDGKVIEEWIEGEIMHDAKQEKNPGV